MIPHKPLLLATLLPATFLLAACSSSTSTGLQESGAPLPVETYTEPYRVGPLDTITVTHKNGASDTLQVTVDDKLEYPDGTPLHVIGHTPDQVAGTLKDRDSAIKSVSVSEYKGNRISVTGEVNIQTNFDLQDSPMRVLDAIATAGGFTPLADASSVRLVRRTSGKVEVYDLNMHDVERGKNVFQDILLEPGDHIFIPRSFL